MKSLFFLVLSVAFFGSVLSCTADSLLITYHNGKTQTVSLDGKSSSIQTLSYLLEDVPATQKKSTTSEPQKNSDVQNKPIKPPEPTAEPKKNGFSFKWAEPITGQ